MARDADLDQGRESYARRRWVDAYEALAAADQAKPLDTGDLELLARSAYMLGRDDEYVSGLERTHRAYLESGEPLRAVRCAWWIGNNLLFRHETAPAGGWFARAQRLVERERGECVERGYVPMATMLEHVFAGEHEAARAAAADVAEIGERFGDRDLVAIGLIDLPREGARAEGQSVCSAAAPRRGCGSDQSPASCTRWSSPLCETALPPIP